MALFSLTDRTPFDNRPAVGEPLLDVSINVRTRIKSNHLQKRTMFFDLPFRRDSRRRRRPVVSSSSSLKNQNVI